MVDRILIVMTKVRCNRNGFVSGLDSGELTRKLNVARFRKKAIMIGVAVVVAIVLFVAVLVIRNNTRNAIRYYEEVIVYGTTSVHEEVP